MGFWYLTSPYSKYPEGHTKAFEEISQVAGWLIRNGIPVYSPIAHSHPICLYSCMGLDDYQTWLSLDEQFMKASVGMIVCKMPSWDISNGVKWEIDWYKKAGKPITYMEYPF